jgi:hypothetical protein
MANPSSGAGQVIVAVPHGHDVLHELQCVDRHANTVPNGTAKPSAAHHDRVLSRHATWTSGRIGAMTVPYDKPADHGRHQLSAGVVELVAVGGRCEGPNRIAHNVDTRARPICQSSAILKRTECCSPEYTGLQDHQEGSWPSGCGEDRSHS